MIDPEAIDFAKGGGLVPVVVQDADTLQVLMLAWADRAAVEETIVSGEATFFSRSRGGRWRKGETSGNRLKVVSLSADCDADTLLMTVRPTGPACHLGTTACFGADTAPGVGQLALLDRRIAARVSADPNESYTARLVAAGVARVAQKVGEEGVETALAAVTADDDALAGEAADLIYHLLVLLAARGLGLGKVTEVLQSRASRPESPPSGR